MPIPTDFYRGKEGGYERPLQPGQLFDLFLVYYNTAFLNWLIETIIVNHRLDASIL